MALLVCFFLAACQPHHEFPPWQYTDLRLLDGVDAAQPSHDLVAAYFRTVGTQMQIRLDWLDLPSLPDYDLYLALDCRPGGTQALPLPVESDLQWDVLLVIPAAGDLGVWQADGTPLPGSGLRVLRDPLLDTLVISMNYSALNAGPNIKIQTWLAAPGTSNIVERLAVFPSGGSPPPPLPVLAVFWNTYPAYTPALALRRWDGAHTGPFGGRHGLYNLLRNAQASRFPLVLLDLKAPAALAALQYAGKLPDLQTGARQGLFILPEFYPTFAAQHDPQGAWLLGRLAAQNRRLDQLYDLPGSALGYSPAGPLPQTPGTRLAFSLQPITGDEPPEIPLIQPQRAGAQVWLAIPQHITQVEQALPDGPALALRTALAKAALAQQQGHSVLVMGGELPASAWGDPQSSRATFKYLNSRPWIQALDAHHLLTLHPKPDTNLNEQTQQPASPYGPALSPEEHTDLLRALRQAPENALGEAAWQAYLALYAPVFPAEAELPALRAEYTSQVWSLLAAAEWAANPGERAECLELPAHQQGAVCVLADMRLYAQFDLQSGALVYLFYRRPTAPGAAPQVHQFIGPSSQVTSGLSSASAWKNAAGLQADPGVTAGAFADDWGPYQAVFPDQRSLVMKAQGAQLRKIITIDHNLPLWSSLQVHYEFTASLAPLAIRLSVLPDSWRRLEENPNNQVSYSLSPKGERIWVIEELIFQVEFPARWQSPTWSGFWETPLAWFELPEDPNRDLPSGHFLPFGLSVIDLSIQEPFTITFKIHNRNQNTQNQE